MGFWVGLRARDFPTERVLSRTPLIIRTVDQKRWNALAGCFSFYIIFENIKSQQWQKKSASCLVCLSCVSCLVCLFCSYSSLRRRTNPNPNPNRSATQLYFLVAVALAFSSCCCLFFRLTAPRTPMQWRARWAAIFPSWCGSLQPAHTTNL